MTQSRRVTLIGTGLMGFPMSQNLLRAGHALTVWNRSIARAEPLAAEGATVASSPVEAVRGAEFIITMLSDGFASGALINDRTSRQHCRPARSGSICRQPNPSTPASRPVC